MSSSRNTSGRNTGAHDEEILGWRVSDVYRNTSDNTNMQRYRTISAQVDSRTDDDSSPAMVTELLDAQARSCSAVRRDYRDQDAALIRHVLAFQSEARLGDRLDLDAFRAAYSDDRFARFGAGIEGTRHPAPFETLVETVRRQRDAGRLARALRGSGTSGVLSGSVSYGAFYSVRGAQDPATASDLDILIVVKDAGDMLSIADRLTRIPGLPGSDVDRFHRRAEVFARHYDNGQTSFSQKIMLWSEGDDPLLPDPEISPEYRLSVHVLPLSVLCYVLVDSGPAALSNRTGLFRFIDDFRDQPTDRLDLHLTFAGRQHFLRPEMTECDGDFLRLTGAYLIDNDDRYAPGFFQTMMLPHFDLLWDDADIAPYLQDFKYKFMDRLDYERKREHAVLRPSFTHPRRGVFAPHLVQRFDSEYSSLP